MPRPELSLNFNPQSPFPVLFKEMRGFLGGVVAGTLSSIVAFGSYKILFGEDKPDLGQQDTGDKQVSPFHRDVLKYGSPDQGPSVRYYGNHVLSYNQAHKIPNWVIEKISAENTKGKANRKNVKFKPDPGVEELFTASNSDYLGSGWSRGHMAPAGDNKHDEQHMAETFYLSNILPQNLDNNAGFWNRFEIYCRKLTEKYPNVRIYSGPLFIAKRNEEDGKKYVKYEVIGQNEVAVPTHLFKIVIVENAKNNPVAMGTFIVPNEPISFQHHLKEFQVPLMDLERRAGARFLPKMNVNHVQDLCQVETCDLMKKTEFDLYFIGRRINNATNLNQLQKAWNELSQKSLEPDEYIKRKYKEKYDELSKKEGG
ncbi:hypothetical protein FSP39_022814 [Pinctada imbricata]|uniref:Nuclease EXOG, mitochondrial n=1 Tax=Pinctada imbricata TaxID=66713 RepID=A0AA89CE69_PINIB|nr:hypothetical protein FSP39_022814 [Pinctada imbricata]